MKFKNGEDYYHKIYLLFNFLIALPLVPFCYLLLLRQSKELIPVLTDSTGQWLVISGLLLGGSALIYFATKQFKEALANQEQHLSFRERLINYYHLSKKKYIVFMLVGFCCVAGLYLTNHGIFIVAYILSVVLLSLKRPTLNGFIEDLSLSPEDEKILVEKEDIA